MTTKIRITKMIALVQVTTFLPNLHFLEELDLYNIINLLNSAI